MASYFFNFDTIVQKNSKLVGTYVVFVLKNDLADAISITVDSQRSVESCTNSDNLIQIL